jgi:Ser/Thr protein kinase RdoA (MazF antagonist)
MDTLRKYIDTFKIDVVKAERIQHEESLSSDIYKLTLKDNAFLILKISYNAKRWQREKYFLSLVKDHILVPKIIDTIMPDNTFSGAILMEHLSGDIIVTKDINDDTSFQMGRMLASLHSIHSNNYGDIASNQMLEPTLDSAIFLLKEKFEKSLDECKDHINFDLMKKIEKYFCNSINEVKQVDGPCIIHRDYKPGNIIIENEKIKGLIDWEIAKMGVAEEDFAQLEYLVWDNYPHTKKTFLEGYESIRKLPNIDEIMPILRVCKALGAMGFTIERKTWDKEHKFIYDLNHMFLEKFFSNL